MSRALHPRAKLLYRALNLVARKPRTRNTWIISSVSMHRAALSLCCVALASALAPSSKPYAPSSARSMASVGRKAALKQAFALALLPTAAIPTVASAATDKAAKAATPQEAAKIQDRVNALYKCSFEESEKLLFSEVGWGDADIKVLSQAFAQTDSSKSKLRKLYLNGNKITDEGATYITGVLKAGSLPKLKILNLAGNKKMTEGAKQALRDAREGLEVS